MLALTIVLALFAACTFATAIVMQQSRAHWHTLEHSATREEKRRWLPVWGALGRLVRDPIWQVGAVLNVVGFGVHSFALHLGPIAVVESVLVVQLLAAIVISDLRRHTPPTHREWVGAAVVCAGVALIVVQRAHAGQQIPHTPALLVYLALAATAVFTLLAVARVSRKGWRRAVLVGLGTGVCFTTTAVMMTVVTARLSQFGLSGLWHWSVLGVVASTSTGALLVQDAFASGPLPVSLTAMTVTDPILSAIAGVVMFDVNTPSTFVLAIGLPTAGLLIACGVGLLATSPTLRAELGQAAGRSSDSSV
ncbi:MAG: DMT family transporter [Aeromicrobium sp.]